MRFLLFMLISFSTVNLACFSSALAQEEIRASNLVASGLRTYCAYAGHWPGTWQEVVDAGIFQVPLRNMAGEVINPDVQPQVFEFDNVYYAGVTESGTAMLHIYIPVPQDAQSQADSERFVEWELEAPDSYLERFSASDKRRALRGEPLLWRPFLEDDNRLRQFAIAGMLEESLYVYQLANNSMPGSMEEFLDSEYSPLGWNSINPLTGQPFMFDGSPDDIEVLQDPDTGALSGFYPVDNEGNVIRAMNMFQ